MRRIGSELLPFSQVEALAMREVARGLQDIFTLNDPGRGARVLLALRDA